MRCVDAGLEHESCIWGSVFNVCSGNACECIVFFVWGGFALFEVILKMRLLRGFRC